MDRQKMDYEQLLAQYEDALSTILELELQIWELCFQNRQLRHILSGLDKVDSGPRLLPDTDGQVRS